MKSFLYVLLIFQSFQIKLNIDEISKEVKQLRNSSKKEKFLRNLTDKITDLKNEEENLEDPENKDTETEIEEEDIKILNDQDKENYFEKLSNKFISDLTSKEISIAMNYLYDKEVKNELHYKAILKKSESVSLQKININNKSILENKNLYPSINKSENHFSLKHSNSIQKAEDDISILKNQETLKQIFKRLYSDSDENEKMNSPLICNNNFLSQFLNLKKEKVSILVKQDMRNICPGLIRSCCDRKHLEERFQIIEKTFENVSHSLSNMIKFFEFIEDLDLNLWIKFVINNLDKAAKCTPNNPMLLIPILKTFIKNKEKYINTYLWYIQNKFVQVLRFQCGMCNFYDNEYFDFDFEKKKYKFKINGKDIENFIKSKLKIQVLDPIFNFSRFFECFGFNWHLTNTSLMNFSISNLNFSLFDYLKDPIHAMKNKDFQIFFSKQYFLFQANIINWGILSRTMKFYINTDRKSSESPETSPIVSEEQIMKVPAGNILFISNNVEIEVTDPHHNSGYINSYNKIDPNTDFYTEFQNSIDDLKNYNEYSSEKVLSYFLTLFFINLIF